MRWTDRKIRRQQWWAKREKEMRDRDLIRQIAMRASQVILAKRSQTINPAYFENHLSITHFDVCPLRLQELYEANDLDFMVEIAGIYANLDILDGSFRNGFYPKFAQRSLTAGFSTRNGL